MIETPQAAPPEDILAVYQFKETKDLLAEALAGADPDRGRRGRTLQATAQAVGENDSRRQELNDRQDFLLIRLIGASLHPRLKAVKARLDAERQASGRACLDRFESAINAADGGEPDLSSLLGTSSLEAEEELISLAITEASRQAQQISRELQHLGVESDRIKGEYFAALAEFLKHESIRKAAAVVAFEGEITLDPDKGRSGEARRLAVYHLGRYRENQMALHQK